MKIFKDIGDVFSAVPLPNESEGKWASPYRLLAGAAYAIGCIECIGKGEDNGFEWKALRTAIDSKEWWSVKTSWGQTWVASYTLTNTLFRTSAATEKTCYLIDPDLKE